MVWFETQADVEAALGKAGLTPASATAIVHAARPCVWMQTRAVGNENDIPIGTTKIGGRPDLPAEFDWPMRPALPGSMPPPSLWTRLFRQKEDQAWRALIGNPFPMTFIAQINLAEVRQAGPLDDEFPTDGLLSIFCETQTGLEPGPGNQRCSRVILFPPDTPLSRRDAPEALRTHPNAEHFTAVACDLRAGLSLPGWDSSDMRLLGLPESDINRYVETDLSPVDPPDHRIGGHPEAQQGDMQWPCAMTAAGFNPFDPAQGRAAEAAVPLERGAEWRLLCQIDCDVEAGTEWVNAGTFYAWIHSNALARRDFSFVLCEAQYG